MAALGSPKASAALTKLPASTTALKDCISRKRSIVLFIETINPIKRYLSYFQ
jgi:hypothetical protein